MSYYTSEELLGAIGDNAPAGPDTVFEPMVITQSAPQRRMVAGRRPNATVARIDPRSLRAAVAQADVQRAAEAAASGGAYLPDVQPQSKGIPNWAWYAAGGVGVLGLGFLGLRLLKGRR